MKSSGGTSGSSVNKNEDAIDKKIMSLGGIIKL